MKTIAKGIYPTMITPYKNGKIDYENVKNLVEWYIRMGCTGIFAVCQSSEMWYLSLDERVALGKAVVEAAAGRINVVVSGHTSPSPEEQIKEVNEMAKTGADAVVLVSNRLDIHNLGDDEFIKNAESLLEKIDSNIALGIYECPIPYKRLLTPRIIDWCISTGRFLFIKDTCCDPDMLEARLQQLNGTGILLYNANEQTALHSMKHGAAGYSGIMANFHPDLLSWLYNNFESQPMAAEKLSDTLSMIAFTEGPAYPCTAKYYLSHEGFNMEIYSRSSSPKNLTSYQKLCMDQMYRLNESLRKRYNCQKL